MLTQLGGRDIKELGPIDLKHMMCHPSVVQVREQDLSVVIHTLSQEFDIYREVGGEPVPVPRDDSSNGFPRSQHGEATF